MLKGEYCHNGEIVPNGMIGEGVEWLLRNAFRAEAVLPANWYIGLTNAAVAYGDSLATAAAGEPVGNGYARQPLVRNTTDWTAEQVNGIWRVRSKTVTFTASGTWTVDYQRMFIASVVSGAGRLLSVSGSLASPVHITAGNGPTVDYRLNVGG